MTNSKASKLGVGLVIGSVIGGLAAFFLSPKSGKENRELVSKKIQELKKMIDDADVSAQVQEIYGSATEEGTKLYKMVSKKLNTHLDDMKKTVSEIDTKKYQKMVGEVIDQVQGEVADSGERLSKLRDYFMDKWNEVGAEVKKDVKHVQKTVKKAVADKS